MVYFDVPKLLHLIKSHLFIFVFDSFALGDRSKKKKKKKPWFMLRSILLLFSSRSFMVSSLTFRSLIHFEFIFVHSVTECSDFILLHVAVRLSQHHLLKKLSFLHILNISQIYSCLLCQRQGTHILSLGVISCPVGLYFWFCVSTMLSWWR